MPTGTRIDPYRSFRFRVEIDGIQTASFSEANIPTTETATKDYREGTDGPTVRKLSALNTYPNLTLKKGLTDSTELYAWRRQVEQFGAEGARRNISLVLLDGQGSEKIRWDITDAWPVKYESTGFNATGGDVMVETLDIAHEGITRVTG
jgi:phage tail-like protein